MGGYQYGKEDDTCFLLVNSATASWTGMYSECNSKMDTKTFDWSRVAPFTSDAVYLDVVKMLAGTGAYQVWLGAQAKASSSGTLLQDYTWMTDQTTAGSALTSDPTQGVNLAPGATAPYCLFADTTDPQLFYGDSCSNAHYAICNYGKIHVLISDMVF